MSECEKSPLGRHVASSSGRCRYCGWVPPGRKSDAKLLVLAEREIASLASRLAAAEAALTRSRIETKAWMEIANEHHPVDRSGNDIGCAADNGSTVYLVRRDALVEAEARLAEAEAANVVYREALERYAANLLAVDNALAFWSIEHPIQVLERVKAARSGEGRAG